MQVNLESFEKMLMADPTLKVGCLVDTNVLFAASIPQDHHNEWAEEVFRLLHRFNVPIFTNLNIRSEFVDLIRRVLIPEGLMDFYKDFKDLTSFELDKNLKSLQTRMNSAREENRAIVFNESEIKKFRNLLYPIQNQDGENAWDIFCEEYVAPYLQVAWSEAAKNFKLNFLGTREIETQQFFNSHPKWEDMVSISGLTGIGTSDAMIINLFLQSSIPLIITADNDVRLALIKLAPEGKLILAPN